MRLWLRMPALLLVTGLVSLAVRYEIPAASLSTPRPIGSAVVPGHEGRTPARAFDASRSTYFLTDAEDGAAFAGLSYSRPTRVLRVWHRYTKKTRSPYLVTGARLQWSDDGESWHDGSSEGLSEAGDITLESLEDGPHRFWRFLVTRSREDRLCVVSDLVFESAAPVATQRARAGLGLAGVLALVLAAVLFVARNRQENRRLLAVPARLFNAANERGTAYLVCAAALFVYYNYFFLFKFSLVPSVAPDSTSYINNSPVRSIGYPAMIDLFDWLGGDWSLFPAVQLNLLVCAIVVLGYAIARVSGSYLLALLYLAGVTQGELLFSSTARVLTEAPFAAFFTLHVGLVLLLLARFTRPRALLAGIVLLCAVAVKPVGMALVAPAALSLLFLRRHWRAAALLLVAPAVLYHLGVSGVNQARYGVFDSSLLGGFALLGHVAWMIEADPGSEHPELSARIEDRVRPLLDRRPLPFESMDAYVEYTAREYNQLLWRNAAPEIRSFLDSPKGPGRIAGQDVRVRDSKVALTLAKEAIARAPGRYAYHVVAHYYGMWSSLFHPGMLARALAGNSRRTIESQRPRLEELLDAADLGAVLEPENFHPAKLKPTLPAAALWKLLDQGFLAVLSKALLVVGLVGSALVVAAFRLAPATGALCMVSLYVNAYMAGHALAQVRLLRYALVMQPAAVAIAVLALLAAFRFAAARTGTGAAASARPATTARKQAAKVSRTTRRPLDS